MIRRRLALLSLAAACIAAAPARPVVLDSQYVLARYALQLVQTPIPKVVVFDYSISQAGPQNIEERHVLYRSGTKVRDETYEVNGAALHMRRVHIGSRPNLYSIDRIAPRVDEYQMLFLKTVKDGRHLDYVYDTAPLVRSGSFVVDRLTIDGLTFLPRTIRFRVTTAAASAVGTIAYAKADKYWVPVLVSVHATVDGSLEREQIAWSDYRFPAHLPDSTFFSPKPLPEATTAPP